jgi:YtkA-like
VHTLAQKNEAPAAGRASRGRAICYVGLLACLLPAGCRSRSAAQPDARLEMRVTPSPPRVGPATLTLTLRDGVGKPLTGATLKLEANMSHPGMVPVFAEAREVQPGQYEASLEFTMGGDWFVTADADFPDGRHVQRQIPVPGVSSNRGG